MPSTSPWALGSHFYIQVTHLPSTSPWALGTFIIRAAHNAFYESLSIGVPFQSFIKHHTYFGNIILITHKLTVSKSHIISMLNSISSFNIKQHAFHTSLFSNLSWNHITPCFSEKPWIQVSINHHAFHKLIASTQHSQSFQVKHMHLFIENPWNQIHKELIYIL